MAGTPPINNDATMYPQMVSDVQASQAAQPNTTTAAPEIDYSTPLVNRRPITFSIDNTPVQTYRQQAIDTAKFALPSIGAGLLDTFGTSLGIIDDNKMGQMLSTVLPAWGDYYERNKEPIQTISDITGMLIPGTLGMKAIQSTAKLRSVIKDAGYAGKLVGALLHSGTTTDELMAGVARGALDMSQKGVRDFSASLPEFDAIKRSAYITKYGDTVKEMLGFEAAVAATMHNSETLYPSDQSLSSYMLLNGFGMAVPLVGEGLFMRRAINKAQLASYETSEHVLNPSGVNWNNLFFTPGNRDLGVTTLSFSRAAQKGSIQEAGNDTTLIENLNKAVLAGDEVIKKQLTSMGTDNPFNRYGKINLTSKFDMSEAQIKTARLMLEDDPTGLLGTVSLEQPLSDIKDINKYYENKAAYVTNLTKDATSAQVAADVAGAAGDTDGKLVKLKEANDLWDEQKKIASSQEFIVERTGEQTPLFMRKPRFTDGNWGLKIDIKRGSQTEPTVYSVKGITDDYYKGQQGVGVTSDFFVLLPKVEPVPETVVQTTKTTVPSQISGPITLTVPVPIPGQEQTAQVMRANIKQIVRPQDLALPENQQLLLRNLGTVFNWHSGQLGKPITEKLSGPIRDALDAWTSNSNSGPLRDWERNGASQFQELYNAFGPMRQQLHELKIAGSDGTIPLWRGESKAETANPTNNLVSMSTDYNVAKNFSRGGNITRVWVPIDDIVASAGLKNENEFIVKNNLARRVGGDDAVIGSTKQNVAHVPITLSVEQLSKLLPAQQEQTITNITKNIAASVPISNYEALDYKGRSAAFALMQKAVDAYKPGVSAPIWVHDAEHWTRLDAVAELINRHGLDAMQGVNFPKAWGQGQQLLDNLNYKILAGKYESFRLLQDMQNQANQGFIKLAANQKLNKYDYQYLLNLPNEKNGDLSPVVKFFGDMYAQGTKDLHDAIPDMNAIKRAIQEHADLDMPQLSNFRNDDVPLRGNNLTVPDGTEPVMALKKNLDTSSFTSQAVAQNIAFERAQNMAYLSTADKYGADLVKLITDTIQNSTVSDEARKTSRLIEGSLPGKGIIGQANHAARGNPTLQAANRLMNMTDVQAKDYIAKLYAPYIPTFNDLRAVNNEGHLLSFNMFEQSRRFGWDLTGETKQIQRNGQNFYGFVMDKDSAYNKKMWARLMGDDVPFPSVDKPMMPAIAGDELGADLYITDKAFAGVNAFSQLGKTALDNMNMIRRTLGLGDLNYKPFWMPPRNLARENVGYLVHGDGSKTVITGRTRAEMQAMRQQEEKLLTEQGQVAGKDFYWQDQKTLATYKDVNDEAFTNLQNFSDPLLQTGRSRGSTAKQTLERGPNVLNDMVTVLNNQLFSIAHRTQALNFTPEINHARMMHQMSGYSKIIEEPSIWQQYINTLYGSSPLAGGSIVGLEYLSTEEQYNKLMAAAFDKVRSWGGTGLNPVDNALELLRNHDKEFQSIRSQLGDFAPFKDTAEFMDKTFKTSVPPTMRQHMGALNQFISTMTLRFLEVGNAILNGVSLMSTTPAVVRSLQRIDGETHADWISRIGAYGSPVGDEIAAFNPARIMTGTVHDFFNNAEFKAAMDRAGKQGLFDQQVAELQKTLVAPQDGKAMSMLRKSIDKLSYISDRSEQLARMYSFGVGYKIGKEMLNMQNEKDLFLFGQKVADDIIGNYRSQNRPMIFQGALGMPLGLFQTYTWNYMHRLFNYVENRQWRAFATQYGMQAAIFGGKTVPGMDQFTSYIANANDGINNPVDALRNRFGDPVADLLLYGTVSNIPKLFGAGDGISVYTRGDANVQRIPGVWSLDRTPIAHVAENTWQILSQTADMFRQTGNFSKQRMGEILGTYLINRPIRNLFQLATGVSVDQSGEVISNDVRNGLSIAARLIGMRPLSESKEVEALSRVTATRKAQEYRMELLRDSARSNLRGNTYNGDALEQSLRQYVKHGGSPVGFASWLRDQFVSAEMTKGQRGLMDSLHNPLHMYDTLRLLHAGVLGDE